MGTAVSELILKGLRADAPVSRKDVKSAEAEA
jgi:hypothetical protein